jgi:3-methyladenine DNA glycosylase AlkD
MQAYMNSEMPFRGVAAAPLRSLLRDVLAEFPLASASAWRAGVLELWDEASFREERYAALALSGHRLYRGFQTPDQLDLYRHLVETGAWWDYVDAIAKDRVGPILRADFDQVSELMRAWAVDDHLWVRRTAILCQLGSRADTDEPLLRWCLVQNLAGRDFFLRKAVGWALREYAKTSPDWVRAFVSDHESEMSGLSRREALKNF